MNYKFKIGAATDVGRVRSINQDSYATGPGIAVVADGMGGHRGGEVASAIAVHNVLANFRYDDPSSLVRSVELANRVILATAEENRTLKGMGTTVVALARYHQPTGPVLVLCNIGDSRAYRLQDGRLSQLTIDHSLVESLIRSGQLSREDAATHPQRNIVTRALGVGKEIDVDDWTQVVVPSGGLDGKSNHIIHDRYLLCSDGLFNETPAELIREILVGVTDPDRCARRLVEVANEGGGRDNITAVVVDVVAAETNQNAASNVGAAPTAAAQTATSRAESAAGIDTVEMAVGATRTTVGNGDPALLLQDVLPAEPSYLAYDLTQAQEQPAAPDGSRSANFDVPTKPRSRKDFRRG